MDELKKEMQDRWNDHALDYDQTKHHGLHDEKEEAFWHDVFQAYAGEALLDVGCGTGFVSMIAARSGLKVTGADWSEGMMEKAREKAQKENLGIRFVQADIEALPFADGTFALLSARHVMWTLTNPERAFREWFRVLKAGGMLFADYSPRKGAPRATHYRLEVEEQLPLNRDVSREEIEKLLRGAGFTDVKVTEREVFSDEKDPHHGSAYGGRYFFACRK